MKKPELLCPAGGMRHLQNAFAYGADAVYAGLPRYSLRVRNNSFDRKGLEKGINYAHARGKKFFLACNIIAHNAKINSFMRDVEHIIDLGPDALIMADPGLIALVKKRFSTTPIHLSVQANAVNYASVGFWTDAGVERVILSRELSLEEIKEIRDHCRNVELEVFVHGALCIAYSGRCLLSGYFNHRDPNQGSCTNSCRWEYGVHEAKINELGDVVQANAPLGNESNDSNENMATPQALQPEVDASAGRGQEVHVALLEEAGRPGELLPAFEDESGTYIMNSKDLRAVEHIEELTRIGVDCFKIEGRTKSPYYVARTAQVYATAIDNALAHRPFDPAAFGALENLANRGYTDGFYRRHQPQELQHYLDNYSRSKRQQLCGEIISYQGGRGLIEVKNKFQEGDSLEVVTPAGNFEIKAKDMLNEKGMAKPVAPGSGHRVLLPLPEGDYRMSYIARNFSDDIRIKTKHVTKDPELKIRRPAW